MSDLITDAMVDAYLKEQARVVFEADQIYGRDGCPAPEYLHPVRDACRAGLRASLAAGKDASPSEWEKLRDPDVLHANLLRGIPAKLSKAQLQHLLGDEPTETAMVTAVRKLLKAIEERTGIPVEIAKAARVLKCAVSVPVSGDASIGVVDCPECGGFGQWIGHGGEEEEGDCAVCNGTGRTAPTLAVPAPPSPVAPGCGLWAPFPGVDVPWPEEERQRLVAAVESMFPAIAAGAAKVEVRPLAGSAGGGGVPPDLHGAIMNLKSNPPESIYNPGHRLAYRIGHRDARHAAAELACAHGIGALPGPDSQQPHVALPRDGGTDKLGGA